jgi:hypothetical protein
MHRFFASELRSPSQKAWIAVRSPGDAPGKSAAAPTLNPKKASDSAARAVFE